MVKEYVIFLLLYFFFCFIAGILNFPYWVVISIGFIGIFTIFGNMLYTVYCTKNMKKVERFLLNNIKKPIYNLAYVQANGTKEEFIEAIDKLLKKHKNNFIHQYYSTVREASCENYEKALELAENIKKEPYKDYIKALIYAKIEKFDLAESLLASITKQFMKEEVLAIISYKKKDFDEFEIHKEKAIESCLGIQRYVFLHIFEKMKKEGI